MTAIPRRKVHELVRKLEERKKYVYEYWLGHDVAQECITELERHLKPTKKKGKSK